MRCFRWDPPSFLVRELTAEGSRVPLGLLSEAPAVLSSMDVSGQELGWSSGSLRVSTRAARDAAKPTTTEAKIASGAQPSGVARCRSDAKEARRSVGGVRGRQV